MATYFLLIRKQRSERACVCIVVFLDLPFFQVSLNQNSQYAISTYFTMGSSEFIQE